MLPLHTPPPPPPQQEQHQEQDNHHQEKQHHQQQDSSRSRKRLGCCENDESLTAAAATGAAAAPAVFAKRRPGWQLPALDLSALRLASFEPLQACDRRQPCPQCQRSRRWACLECCVALVPTPTPAVRLPFELVVVTHPNEPASKNTGAHAKLLCAPGQVRLCGIDALPGDLLLQPSLSGAGGSRSGSSGGGSSPGATAVLFPAPDARTPDELGAAGLKRVVVIDTAWQKAKELNGHMALAGLPRVKLPGSPRSAFWRFHTRGVAAEGVCTIEAIWLLAQAVAGAYSGLCGGC